MQKKLLAIAVAGALGAPAVAMAQASTVQVFGQVYLEYGFTDQGGGGGGAGGSSAAPSDLLNVDGIQTPGSEIGFKGEEKLGAGLSAWFQCNSTFDVRGATNGFCGRNSAIGLKGGFGNLFIGNWDTPFKRTMGVNRITNETGLFGASFLLTGGASSFEGRSNPQSWSRRQNNSINYDSPTMGGFQVSLSTNALGGNSSAAVGSQTGVASYTPGAIGSNATTAMQGAKARLWSVGAIYRGGPLSVSAGYENHKNFWSGGGTYTAGVAPASFGGTDKAWHVGANYTFAGKVKVGAIYTSQDHDTPGNTNLKLKAWHLGVDWKFAGPHGIRLGYTKADDTKGNFVGTVGPGTAQGARIGNAGAGGTGADLMQISYVHSLSKRTEATVGYVRLDNEANARYALGGMTRPRAGENQDAFAFTIRHRF